MSCFSRCLRGAGALPVAGALLLAGCASPGAPKPPSLQLPQPVRDLVAGRSGNRVELSFTLPDRTTDDLPLREGPLEAVLCRQLPPAAGCEPVSLSAEQTQLPLPTSGADAAAQHWSLVLPAPLTVGPPRVVAFRLTLRNAHGRDAGPSAPAFTLAGEAPLPPQDLAATGVRTGILLRWAPLPDAGEVLLQRTQEISPVSAAGDPEAAHPPDPGSDRHKARPSGKLPRALPPAEHHRRPGASPAVTWLQADPHNLSAVQTIDGTVVEGAQYRYVAVRRRVEQIEGHTLELRSAPSSPVNTAWRDIYPPSAPSGLTAAAFAEPGKDVHGYAVDLIWQPVQDLRLAGYLVSRTPLDAAGQPLSAQVNLTPLPVTIPSFHDGDAVPERSYRYEVRSVDAKGNRSPATTTDVPAQAR